jgi:hypothetical protein
MRLLFGVVVSLTFALSCAPPPQAGKGGKCHAITDCKPGLACIEGKCSTDLSSIEGEIPEYAAADAGASATPPQDATTP